MCILYVRPTSSLLIVIESYYQFINTFIFLFSYNYYIINIVYSYYKDILNISYV